MGDERAPTTPHAERQVKPDGAGVQLAALAGVWDSLAFALLYERYYDPVVRYA
jgi:hypothetical protein